MKNVSKIRYVGGLPDKSCASISDTERFHPLSYYLNGGIDLSGDALDNSGDAEYDNEEQMKEILAEGASSVALGDPRMSKFHLVEKLGAKMARSATAKSPVATTNKTTTTTTTE